tara:strand:- start:1319 stop:2029 length:711 start_codon:yes stop_codon:yes gene_type:complete
MKIKDNLFELNKEIEEICKHSKRLKEDITLIAVSKGRDVNAILKLNGNNQKNFGENKVQEITKKYNELFDAQIKNNISWHFIGHLQTNKINKLIPIIDTLHSLDSIRLLEAIESYYRNRKNHNNHSSSNRLKCFIQVNIAEEKQKRGIMVNEINELVARCRKSEVVEIKGLMTIPPLSNNEENSREFFQKLKFLADQQELKSLSMGMTNDYRIAIEEGATHLRIGRKIFANNTAVS